MLKEVARRQMRRERAGHTLQTTALVHEAWLRLRTDDSEPRAQVLARAATTMRRVLVDHARRQCAARRGARPCHLPLAMAEDTPASAVAVDVLVLDEALNELAQLDQRQARIVELRYFAGLSTDETADVLGVSRRTVHGDWSMARAFLRRRLEHEEHP